MRDVREFLLHRRSRGFASVTTGDEILNVMALRRYYHLKILRGISATAPSCVGVFEMML